MAGERRTKAQKEKTAARRMEHTTYSFTAADSVRQSQQGASQLDPAKQRISSQRATSLFSYDPTHIYQDLRKTVLITILIFALLIGIRSYFG